MTSAVDIPLALRDALANRYSLERELGRGGMATVYLAQDRRHDRPVALKVLHAAQGAALGAERFDREIRLLARLRHPFVLPLHDSGEAAGDLFFVMPFIDGESLRSRLERDERLSLADAGRIVGQIADALDYAHGEGVIHRDVKPENILLSRHGHALLADFGIARGALLAPEASVKLTQAGIALGTASYMSPEQALGEQGIDGRSDVYSLGCVLFEMLAGRPPFTGPTALSIVVPRARGTARRRSRGQRGAAPVRAAGPVRGVAPRRARRRVGHARRARAGLRGAYRLDVLDLHAAVVPAVPLEPAVRPAGRADAAAHDDPAGRSD
jgi:serine/threonine protein kinase